MEISAAGGMLFGVSGLLLLLLLLRVYPLPHAHQSLHPKGSSRPRLDDNTQPPKLWSCLPVVMYWTCTLNPPTHLGDELVQADQRYGVPAGHILHRLLLAAHAQHGTLNCLGVHVLLLACGDRVRVRVRTPSCTISPISLNRFCHGHLHHASHSYCHGHR